MTPCPDENELVLLADGALADRRRASIDRHLDGCAPCTRLVAELAGMAAPVRPVPARYRIIRQLGAGAMGVVWEAEDRHLGRRVALKFVRATTSGEPDARRTRLFREARALAQLRHPNVVTVYDVGTSGDELFLALELVIGMDARTWRDARPRTAGELLAVWSQAAAGLAAVHRAGIVHRDIKPDNVLVADDGRVLVGDFGLATDRDAAASHRVTRPDGAEAAATATGTIVGTPIYMAYEQLVGEPASQRSDQFALCVSIWEALAGTRPFTGATLGAIAMAMQRPPAPPPGADRHVFAVLARGLDPDPAKRWPGVDALLAALAHGPAPRTATRTRLLLAVGAAVVAAAATAGVLAWRDGRTPAAAAAPAPGLDGATPTERALPSSSPDRDTSPGPADRGATPANGASRGSAGGATPADRASPGSADRGAAPAVPGAAAARGVTPAMRESSRADRASRHSSRSSVDRDAPGVGPREVLERAARRLAFGDARACLALLDTVAPAPAAIAEQAATLRATCTMKAGDCAGGRAVLEAIGRAYDWEPMRLAETVRLADLAYCPLDAGPRAGWAERARYRLRYAVGAKLSCEPVLAFVAARDVALPDRREQLVLEAGCHANAGACAAARGAWRASFAVGERDPARVAAAARRADAVFGQAFVACAP